MAPTDIPTDQIELSVVIPMFNEEESVAILNQKLVAVLENIGKQFEIIFIDDGSTDNSVQVVSDILVADPRVILIELKTNMGKARGLSEGFKAARGNIVFTMDADLQDDPNEIPNFLKKLNEGYDLVSGWKKKRHDPLEKRLPSKLFNKTTSLVTGLKLHDFNCGFKAYRKEILDEIRVYGDLHRYVPALAYWQGYRVGEIPVQHHVRQFGESKYGFERYLRGLFDLFTVSLLTRFIRNPMALFGSSGLIFLTIGLTILSFLTVLQALYGSILGHRPLSFLAVLLILIGGQFFTLGMLAEFLVNIFQKKSYRQISIKNKVNFQESDPKQVNLSVVVPVCNEAGNIQKLFDDLSTTLASSGQTYEVVFVDDGSTDETEGIIIGLCDRDEMVRLIRLRKRFGKASALNAGFRNARGNVLVTMDGDLQDDPAHLPEFLDKLKSCDMVVGNRVNVPPIRKLFSSMFNRLVSIFSGSKMHDINCGLKAFRKDVIHDLNIYGGLQRFFPVLVMKNGYKVVEIDVPHKERFSGKSKFNWTRIPRGFFNLAVVVLLSEYYRRPLHLFGAIGLLFALGGFTVCASLSILKILTGTIQGHNTLLLLGVMTIIFGFQWISTGLLGEIIAGLDEEIEMRSVVKRKMQNS